MHKFSHMNDLALILCCPYCHGDIERRAQCWACTPCRVEFPLQGRTPDFRLTKPLTRTVSFAVGSDRPRPDSYPFQYPMEPARDSRLDEAALAKLHRPQRSLLSYVPRPARSPAYLLDLGCGSSKDREFVEALGYTYVGVDLFDDKAPMMADGHALPFRAGTFDVVFALTVMEHFHNPFVATTEVKRVLAPKGRFIGTVETLVPFHMGSYYNMTRFGIYNVLAQSGLEPVAIAPATGWTGLVAHYNGSYWPGIPRKPKVVLAKLQDRVSRGLWKLRAAVKKNADPASERDWMLKFAGGFKFVADKPAA